MIGLSSLSLDSYISVKDAAGICIKDYIFLIWTKNSFSLGDLKEFQTKLRSCTRGSKVEMDLKFLSWENEILKIEFYNDSLLLADKIGLSIWNQKVMSKVGIQNLKSFSLNPEFKPNICATLLDNGAVGFCDLNDMKVVDVPLTWSRKGKQIACGTKTGEILFFNTNAELKNKIARPEKLSEPCYVQNIEWLQDKSFLVFYICQDEETHVIQILEDKVKKELLFLDLDDPAASFGSDRTPLYFCHVLRSWDFDTLLISANSASTDVGLIGSQTESSKLENWDALEAYQFTLPLDENQDDTWPISSTIDLYSDAQLSPLTPDQPHMPSCPILWILNNKGQILACDIISTEPLEKGIQYPSMIKEISKPLSLKTVSAIAGSINGQSKEPKIDTAATAQAAVKKEIPKLTTKDVKPIENSPLVGFKVPQKSAFSFPKISTAALVKEVKAEKLPAPSIQASPSLKIKDDSSAILITQFNKAYKDFQLDISKLSNFSSDLSSLALSNTDSNTENMSTKSQRLSAQISLIQDSLNEEENELEELKSQLLHTWSKKEESDRLLKTLKTKDQEKNSNSSPSLGPEAEDLKKLLNSKKKKIESSILDLNQVLEDLRDRVDSQKKGKKIIGDSQNWYTLCKTVQRITNAAIDANLSLDDLEKKMNQMSVSSRKKTQSLTRQFSPSKSPYGLLKEEDLLAEDIQKKLHVESYSDPFKSKLIAFLTSDRYSPPSSKCKSRMPNMKKELVKSEYVGVKGNKDPSNLTKSVLYDETSNIENLPAHTKITSQAGFTLEEKIKKLDSTPPTKNEYVKPELKPSALNIAPLTAEKGISLEKEPFAAPKSDLVQSELAPPSPLKLEPSIKPSISGFSGQKSYIGFEKVTSPLPNSNPSVETAPPKPTFTFTDNSSAFKLKDGLNSKDDPENPFLVNSKTSDSLSNGNLKIPEKKSVFSTEKSTFSFSPVQIPQKDDPNNLISMRSTNVALDQGQTDFERRDTDSKDSFVDPEQKTTLVILKENTSNSDGESESSNESAATGDLINEDDLDESEIAIEPEPTTDQEPDVGKLDFFGDSKPKNSVNPIFGLAEEEKAADSGTFSLKSLTLTDFKVGSNEGSANEGEKLSEAEKSTIEVTDMVAETAETDKLSDALGQETPKEISFATTTKPLDSVTFGNTSIQPEVPLPSSTMEITSVAQNNSESGTGINNLGQGDTKSSPFAKSGQPVQAFGQSLPVTSANSGGSSTPAFGQSSVFGVNNSAGQFTPPFGQSNTSFTQSTPVFGQSTTSFPQSTPVFGQNASTFGQSTPVFGQATPAQGNLISEPGNKTGFGQNAGFGSFSKPAFGQSGFNFGSASNSNSFAALGNTTSPSPDPSSFSGISQTGFGVSQSQGFNTATSSAMPLGPGQALAGNVAFGARTGLGSNAPSIGFAQPSFPNVSGTQGLFGASSFGASTFGSGNSFGGSGSSAPSGFAAFAAAAPAASFGSNAPTAFGNAGQQNTSIFGSGNQTSTGFGSRPFNSGFGQNPSNKSAFSQHRG